MDEQAWETINMRLSAVLAKLEAIDSKLDRLMPLADLFDGLREQAASGNGGGLMGMIKMLAAARGGG